MTRSPADDRPSMRERMMAGDPYAAYDEHPLDEPDEWGDLTSFRQAAGRS